MSALDDKIARFIADLDKVHLIVHGDNTVVVVTDGGSVPSFAKIINDNLGLFTLTATNAANDANDSKVAAGLARDAAVQAAQDATDALSDVNLAAQAAVDAAGAANTSKLQAAASANAAVDTYNATVTAKDAAAGSAAAANGFANTASGAATTATNKATAANDSAVAANTSASAANTSKLAAATSESNAHTSELNAATSAGNASTSAAAAAAAMATVFVSQGMACSDESMALVAKVAQATFRSACHMTLSSIRASLTTAATGATLFTIDVKVNGVTILSTKLTFTAGSKTSVGAATPPVYAFTDIPDDSEITIDIISVGSVVAGAGLKVQLLGNKAP